MESLKSPIMHATDTKPICSTLPCDDNGGDEISKNLEDELLYGANEDGDEDDAQSDDSLRLRLSDDDVDVDDIGASLPTNQLTRSEKTEPLDMEFDVHTSNHCSIQHRDNSSGMCSIASKHNGFKKELDFTNDHVLMGTNFCDTGAKNPFECGTSQFLKLNAVKYTYGSRRKFAGSFKTRSSQANQSFSVNRSYPDHSYHSIMSNRYGNRYYNQNSHYGRCRGYKFGEFNTYFNSFGLERKCSLRVYPPSRKVLSEKKYITPGSNSQTNVSAIENASHKDNSSTGISDTQHKISNDIDVKSIITDNKSPQLTGSELSTDKLDTSLNPSEKISLSFNNKHEPKENGIVDKENEIETTGDTNESINSEDRDTTEKLVHKSDAEPSDMPINIKTEVDDISESTSVNDPETGCDNLNHEEIKDAEPSTSNTVLTALNDNLPNDETITDKEKPAGSIQDKTINSDKETMVIRKDGSEIIPDNGIATNDGKNADDNSANLSVPDCNKSDEDNSNHKGENKIGTKRPLNVTDNDNSVCEKKSCIDSNVNEPTSKDEVEIEQVLSTEAPSNTEDCLELKSITENKSITHKLDNEIAKLNNVNDKSESLEEKTSILPIEILDDDDNLEKDDDKLEITAVIPPTEMSNKGKRRRRKRKTNPAGDVANSGQEKENVRQKRETAQKAEELIRKRFQKNDSDSESSDNVQTYVTYNKPNPRARPSSPPSLKRNCPDETNENNMVKKVKNEIDTHIPSKTIETVKSSNNCKTLEQVRKFFWRDGKKSLSKFTQEELEELLIQKVIETITMRDEIGKLREQAKISERNQEATRLKCQQLTKQIKDFEMVLNRFSADRRGGDKNVPPIKINRSVGLQVNFVTDNGVQNLRQLQHTKSNATTVNGGNAPTTQPNELPNSNSTVRKGIKVRSPRRTSDVPPASPTVSVTSTQIQSPVTPTVTPAVLVVPKSTDNRLMINSVSQVVAQQGSITLNGAVTTTSRQSKVLNTRSNNSNSDNLIDLTGEEEKSKNVVNPPPLAAITTSSTPAIIPKAPPRYQRVIQPTPANVTVNQPAFKIVQPVDKPMPTTIVNNMNASRLTFVMHNINGPPRHVMLAPNVGTNPTRPGVATNNRPSFTGITYTGVSTIQNGSVRVVPATTTAQQQKNKHPAPLPGITTYPVNAALKLPPPAPSLKISKVANGIVLSWNMRNSDEYAEIASYQLYAYQEVTGVAPSTALWKKVGDVRALPLPMACTLTQFSEGNNYYFAVRGVDTHSRLGQYSQPGNISL